ncbi:hypothetical protein GF380_03850 [Candidatus Uhrbacteria bacterium]|nr:hypothetical protein [Candidatus Uhrbacteria bacterium]MBD3284227.1 hypothetical protein [Candidatus Uhrbacteria bacterium]
MGYRPTKDIDIAIEKCQRTSQFARPYHRALLQVEARRPVTTNVVSMVANPRLLGQEEGTITDHPQISLAFTDVFKRRQRPLYQLRNNPEAATFPDPMSYIVIRPRQEDCLNVLMEQQIVDAQPEVIPFVREFLDTEEELKSVTNQIEAKCAEIDPSYPGYVLAMGVSTGGWKRDEKQSEASAALRKIRQQVEPELYQKQEEMLRQLEQHARELYQARETAWGARKQKGRYERSVCKHVLRTALAECEIEGLEGENKLLDQMVKGLSKRTFALYYIQPQFQGDDPKTRNPIPTDALGAPLDAVHNPCDIRYHALLECVQPEAINKVIYAGNGYFAYCVNHHAGGTKDTEFHSSQGNVILGRVTEQGGYAVILPLPVWRALFFSAEYYYGTDYATQTFKITGHIEEELRAEGYEEIEVEAPAAAPDEDDEAPDSGNTAPPTDASGEPSPPDAPAEAAASTL